MKLVEQMPDPGHAWVRYRLRPWPAAPGLWLDLSSCSLGRERPAAPAEIDLAALRELDDVLYLPPTAPADGELRQQILAGVGDQGPPILLQSLPGEPAAGRAAVDLQVIDVLHPVVTGDWQQLQQIPASATVLWPLVAGYSDEPGQWKQGLEILASIGVGAVRGVAADLAPADRRRVVELAGDRGFERLFHGPTPDERAFAATVYRTGMRPFLGRPLPAAPSRLTHNRHLAGILLAIGELWLRLGRQESRGQAFFRAARWTDRESHDLMLLTREGNLGVVSWLDPESRQVIEEVAAEGRAGLLDELEAEYLDLQID